MKIAHAQPFSGAPHFTCASVFGASPDKPFLWRIPVLGKRPLTISVSGLPQGLSLQDNTVRGITSQRGEFELTLTAENQEGTAQTSVRLIIEPGAVLRTPLLGFTTWNAVANAVDQQFVQDTAQKMVESGLAEYGYSYVNLDSGWQGVYGGKFDAIQPNEKFPNIRAMTDSIHALGLKAGIYSTPMLTAWGCPDELDSIPGCTRGEADIRFTVINGGIGVERLEQNNAAQWTEWGFDYLKYDWAPVDPVNAEPMRAALAAQPREFAFCTTVRCAVEYANYWKKYVNSWRDNADTRDEWNNVTQRMDTESLDQWRPHVGPGRFYDLDMLAIGPMYWNEGKCRLTQDEEIFSYTLHAFFPSPVQISCRLEEMTDFEFDLLANEEMIAINQDALCDYPLLVRDIDKPGRCEKIYTRRLENGDLAVAVFNLCEDLLSGFLQLPQDYAIREVWSKTDRGVESRLNYQVDAHCARVFRLTPQ
ncbi:MAG: hypothetical protein IJC25_07125 [Clostridia bacterium]|nr:hypothetical protein [Clostridia bacterium]